MFWNWFYKEKHIGISKMVLVMCSLFSLITHCSEETDMWEEQIPNNRYWYTQLNLENGSRYFLDFEVVNGGRVDLLFVDDSGLLEFQNRIFLDTIYNEYHVIPKDTFAEHHFPVVESDEYAYRIVWARVWEPPVPIDLYITNHINYLEYLDTCYFDYYVRYDNIDHVEDTIKVEETEDLYFIIDNTEFFGSPPDSTFLCTLSIGKLIIQPFEYFQAISGLNCGTMSGSIQAPDADPLYLIINNAGYVEGGAIPSGPVEFKLNITHE